MLRLRRRDEAALAELYRRFAPRLHALAIRMLGSREEAEEIVQDVFVKIFRRPDLYRPELASPAAYLNTMARNAAVSRLRRDGSRPRPARGVDVHDPQAPFAAARTDPADRVLAQELLGWLEPEERELLEAAFLQGFSHGELAERSGIPLGTVKSRLRRALQKLRRRARSS